MKYIKNFFHATTSEKSTFRSLLPLLGISIFTLFMFLGIRSPLVLGETPLTVDIDIKPGDAQNCINVNANGVIPVAILTTASFDASTVDAFSIELASASVKMKGKSGNAGSLEDIDADGDLDLVVQVVNEIELIEGQNTATLTGLTKDKIPIVGTDSVCIIGEAIDITAPAAITDLIASNPTTSSIDLSWSAPGDNGSFGTAAWYDIRYSTSTITDGNWSSATLVYDEPTPLSAGSSQSMTIAELSEGTYYFAIKTFDEVANVSGLSNVASSTTACSTSIATGEQVYNISSSNEPRFTQVIFNPLDVMLGGTQLVTVKVKDNNGNPITSVEATANTENDTTPFSLSLVSGTAVDGTWEGTWTLQDANCSAYQISIDAASASGTSNVTVTFR